MITLRALRPILAAMTFCCVLVPSTLAQGQAFKHHVIDAHRPAGTMVSPDRIGNAFRDWQQSNAVLRKYRELRHLTGFKTAQILAYDRLAGTVPSLDMQWDPENGDLIYLSGSPLQRSRSTATGGSIHEATARAFFQNFSALLGISDASETFIPALARQDETGRTHLRFTQLRAGIPVYGKEIVCGITPNGDLDLFMGRYSPSSRASAGSFRLTPDAAVLTARAHAGVKSAGAEANPFLTNGGEAAVEKCWFDDGKALRAAYAVQLHSTLLERWQIIVSADDGSIIRSFNAVCTDGPEKATAADLHDQSRTIDTYLHSGSYYLIDATRPMYDATNSVFPNQTIGTIVTLSANNSDLQNVTHLTSADNTWGDKSSVSAHYLSSLIYEYYRATHGRNSLDDNGGSIISVVNVTEGGASMENAFWNGRIIAYGNGGTDFEPFAKSMDIAAHELTHGVTEHSAGLEYLNQSGALNEAFSDIFAAMVDRDDWTIGEDITRVSSNFPDGTMRSLEDPHNGAAQGAWGWQPKHMNEYQNLPESQDNGGVHVNSGIVNHSAYLLAQQIGREKAEKVFYNALTTKLTRQSRFIDYRLAIIRAAEELYSATEAQACADACDQVGILDGKGTDRPDDYPAVDGIDRMLFTNTDPFLQAPLWIAVPPATGDQDFTSVSFTNIWSRPSISDNGSVAVFVSDEFNIHAVSLVGNPNEQILDNSQIWNSIALSRDLNRIAVTTILLNPELFLIDVSGPTPVAKKFSVYTPTYSGESVPNTAQFVDAMEFSLDDEVLLFDTYNEVSIGGFNYGFWDINAMNVWNPVADTYGDGRIDRIFPPDPSMNLGNPTFAKTKPTVIAFDAQFDVDGTSFVMAMDVLDPEPKTVAAIPFNTYGYPNYSGNDGTLSFVISDQGLDVVYNVSMQADGITAAGSPGGFIAAATWPLWFRSGERPTAVDALPTPAAVELDQNYPNPFNPSTTLHYSLQEAGAVSLAVYDALGRRVATLYDGPQEAGSHRAAWNGRSEAGVPLASGVYTATLIANGATVSRHMLLLK